MKNNLFKSLIFAQVILCVAMLVSCIDTSAGRKKWESKMQTAIGKGDFTEARACAAKAGGWYGYYKDITRAQIALLMNSGNLEQAFSLSQEENMVYAYFELFMPKLIEVYESKGKSEVLKNLALVQFEYATDLNDKHMWDDDNTKYNKEATKYNTSLDQFITYLDIKGDRDFAIQVIRFVKPIVVPLLDTTGDESGVQLSTQPQEDIKKKLGL